MLTLNRFQALLCCLNCNFEHVNIDWDKCNFKKKLKIIFAIACILKLDPILNFSYIAQNIKFFIKGFFNKCDQTAVWSHLLKKFLMENFIFLCNVAYFLMDTSDLHDKSSMNHKQNPTYLYQLSFLLHLDHHRTNAVEHSDLGKRLK